MAADERLFHHESFEDSRSIVDYLEAITEGFRSGALKFSNQKQEVVIHPRGLIKFRLRAQRKRDGVHLSLKFGIREKEDRGEDTGQLRIHRPRD